jgi:EAL domain-containing protein (putative c-di-GMP-specific phosphodiesterase class I)
VETVATEPWQPRLALATQKCVGFDIDTSADGLAPTLRETVLSRFAQYGADAGQNVLGLHIAMSRNGFYTENLAAWLRMLTRFGLEPSQISWTIPVDVVRDDLGRAKARCEQVRATGIGVVVTGFGAGYDSLAWLPSLPLSGVSFDPRVIDVVCANADHAATVRRIVSLAHALSVRVSASGLHDALRFAAARLLDCDEGTGVGLGSPGVGPAVSTMAPVVTSTLDDPNRGFFSTRGTGANGADHGGAFATRSAFTKQGGVRTARFKEY